MFGLSVATELIQGSTERTWNCVLHFVNSLWSKFNHNNQNGMPKSRKRHHSRSRSRSRSHSRDRSRDRDDKYKRNDSHDKDRDGKRRKIDSYDSPPTKRSVSEEPEAHKNEQDKKNEDTVQSITDTVQVQMEDDHQKENGGIEQKDKSEDDNIIDTENNEQNTKGTDEETSIKVEIEVGKPNVLPDNSIEHIVDPKIDEDSLHIAQSTSDDIVTLNDESTEEAPVVTTSHNNKVSVTSEMTDGPLDKENSESDEKIQSAKDVNDVVDYKAETTKEKDNDFPCSNKVSSSDVEQQEIITEAMDVDESKEKNESSIENVENSKSPNKGCDKEKLSEPDVIEIDDKELVDSNRISEEKIAPSTQGSTIKKKLEITPQKYLSPKQMQKKMESEKKRLERQKEKEEKERKKNEDRERILKEKQKKKEEKQKELEQKQKEKELKDEQKKKEREEKELKKREKEEKDEQKRKEKEQEKLKKQEKEMEKQKEEEKKQKAAAAFANFFVTKRSETQPEEKRNEIQSTAFMAFEVKSDMKLPPARRSPLSDDQKGILDNHLNVQNYIGTYLQDLKCGKVIGKCPKTWPYEDAVEDDDVEIIEEESGIVGETICEDVKPTKLRAKFLKFHENRRPAYFGTWRKKSKFITPRKPFIEDADTFNYAEDSDDDWEEEEQGESLTGSDDEADKENEDEKDDYEVDNEFFVPHGHLSDDEVDDEQNKRMSPESMKQKLKLLKDEFDQDMKSKTHKLKPKAIGCIWYKKERGNVDEAIHKYLQPLAIICRGNIEIKSRSNIFTVHKVKQKKQLNPDVIPLFIKFIHGSEDRKKNVFEKFKSYMFENGNVLEFSKRSLLTYLNENVTWKKIEGGSNKNKMNWIVNADILKKYSMDISVSNVDGDK